MVYNVIDEYHVEQYSVLFLDKKIIEKDVRSVSINGKLFDVVPSYDMDGLVIESRDNFKGKQLKIA